MILCLDVGNTQIYGGVFKDDSLLLQFRRSSPTGASSDETGLFLRSVLRENGLNPDDVSQIAICSVVPDALHSLKNCCLKYFKCRPFVLQAGVKTGLKIKYRNPVEVGADRISNAVAAIEMFPDQNLIVVDFGTATTFCAINAQREYLGGVIIPGMKISMRALESNTAKLPAVEILQPPQTLGRGTVESIQSGLFYGAVGAIREITERITNEVFPNSRPLIIGTGGFASLFSDTKIFDQEIPDLVLQGLRRSLILNT
ncbi:MAG: type III pantothenate kinase [Pseudobdellovibrionaceae bacterium]|nr:type III pantothenate kinase [Bdellovibrionales bacterium]USN47132.1 MAG: type III pantothenate kinase [Pseudobdellovibrionaceae bacterium]